MAKELMEIGGFITSGAEIVNHDNTLSGNGTVDSPLGVVPGYNETVLWTNSNPKQMSANVTLTGNFSENCSNFEKLRFICKASYDTGETISAAVQSQDFYVNTANNVSVVGIYLANRRGTNLYRDNCEIDFVHTGFTALNGSRLQGLTGISENTSRGPYILQVVGINRKAQ